MAEQLIPHLVDDTLSHLLQHQRLGSIKQHDQDQRRQIQPRGLHHSREPLLRPLPGLPVFPAFRQDNFMGFSGNMAVNGVPDNHRPGQL